MARVEVCPFSRGWMGTAWDVLASMIGLCAPPFNQQWAKPWRGEECTADILCSHASPRHPRRASAGAWG